MTKTKTFLAFPYSGMAYPGAFFAGYQYACRDKDKYLFFPKDGPWGAHCELFNSIWCSALNSRARDGWTHFAMIHSDVEPEEYWLDKLLDEMERVNADVLSVVLAIKDPRGLTSTCLMDKKTLYIRRLTMKEVCKLPETFDATLAGEPDSYLLFSSGLWVCRFTEPWVERVWFEMRDRVGRLPDGNFFAWNFSEDWGFARQCQEQGLRVFSTRKISAMHRGPVNFGNQKPWGTMERDEGSFGEWLWEMEGMSSLGPGVNPWIATPSGS
jgi:hypothetical protein